MAINYDRDNNEYSHIGVPFNYTRGNPIPLDNSSVWTSYLSAAEYAKNSPVAYVGQLITVSADGTMDTYVIENAAGTLKKLASGGSTEDLHKELTAEVARSTSVDNELSGAISTIVETTLPNLSSDLSSKLSVTVELQDTPEADFAATYYVMQGGVKVGDSINIPKDKVISSAYMVTVVGNYDVTVTPADLSSFTVSYADESKTVERDQSTTSATYWSIWNAYTGPEGGDGSYLRITVTNDEATPIYIAVPELVDTYIGGETNTISVGVTGKKGETRIIYADVKDGSISESMLCTDFTTKVNGVIAAEAEDRSVIEILSGGETVDGSVKKALADAKAYTDSVSSLLSNAISDEYETKSDASGKLTEAKGYTDEVSAALSTDYTAKISAAISALDYTDTAVEHKFVTKVSETDGIIEVTRSEITSADISGLSDVLSSLKSEVIGSASDLSSADTVYGAKAYAAAISDDLDVKLTGYVQTSAVLDYDQVSDTNKIVTQKDIAALTGVMHFKGVATNDALSTGSTVIPVPPYASAEDTPVSGDFVIDKVGSEFVWALSSAEATPCWYKIGDETIYASKAALDQEILDRKEADNEITAQISAISSELLDDLNAEVAARVAADNYLSGQLSGVIKDYVKSIVINGEEADVVDNVATLSIEIISCGNAGA